MLSAYEHNRIVINSSPATLLSRLYTQRLASICIASQEWKAMSDATSPLKSYESKQCFTDMFPWQKVISHMTHFSQISIEKIMDKELHKLHPDQRICAQLTEIIEGSPDLREDLVDAIEKLGGDTLWLLDCPYFVLQRLILKALTTCLWANLHLQGDTGKQTPNLTGSVQVSAGQLGRLVGALATVGFSGFPEHNLYVEWKNQTNHRP